MDKIYEYTISEKKYRNKIIKNLNVIGFLLSFYISAYLIVTILASSKLADNFGYKLLVTFIISLFITIVVNLTLRIIFDYIKKEFTTVETLHCKLELNDSKLFYKDDNTSLTYDYEDIVGLSALFRAEVIGFKSPDEDTTATIEIVGNTGVIFKIPLYCDSAINYIKQKTGREIEYYTD